MKFPARKIITLYFGEEELTNIYINSAGGDNLRQNGQLAGALFHLRLGMKGKCEYRYRLDS
jgi:D-xylonolactonase